MRGELGVKSVAKFTLRNVSDMPTLIPSSFVLKNAGAVLKGLIFRVFLYLVYYCCVTAEQSKHTKCGPQNRGIYTR